MMREEFEAAAKAQGLSTVRTHTALCFANGSRRAVGDYVALETMCAWWAWQASREAIEIELPDSVANTGTLTSGAVLSYKRECAEAIRAQGLRVKQ